MQSFLTISHNLFIFIPNFCLIVKATNKNDVEKAGVKMEIYENEQNKNIEDERNTTIEKEKNTSKRKSNVLLSSVTGAIIGSAITLFAGSSLGLIASPTDHKADQAVVSPSGEQSKGDVPIQTTSASSSAMVDTIDQVSKAVVGVVNYQQKGDFFSNDLQDTESGTGSGVVFKKTGDRAYIVTNNHVIQGASKVEVTLASGQKTQARCHASLWHAHA